MFIILSMSFFTNFYFNWSFSFNLMHLSFVKIHILFHPPIILTVSPYPSSNLPCPSQLPLEFAKQSLKILIVVFYKSFHAFTSSLGLKVVPALLSLVLLQHFEIDFSLRHTVFVHEKLDKLHDFNKCWENILVENLVINA